jgi:hypothetical protein
MDPARFARLKEIFLAARDLPPEERDAYLDRACVADPLLRRQIKSMIEQDSESLDILHPRAFGDLVDAERDFPDANAYSPHEGGLPAARGGPPDAGGFPDAAGSPVDGGRETRIDGEVDHLAAPRFFRASSFR